MSYLTSVKKEFLRYKSLGDKAMAQVADEALHWQYNEESNSIATTVKHIWGNMLSRWTNFLTEDGEKEWRQRDAEFEEDKAINRQLAHYPYHVGQIVYLARMQAGDKWTSLSIARNKSDEFNREKFGRK